MGGFWLALPSVVKKCSRLSSFPKLEGFSDGLTGWVSDMAVAYSEVMGIYQNLSPTAAITDENSAKLFGVVWI